MKTMLQVLVLGDAGVGKTCLVEALARRRDCSAGGYAPSISPEATVTEDDGNDNTKPVVRFWDYPGSERFMAVRGSCDAARRIDCCLLVYDVHSKRSLEHLTAWYDEYLQFAYVGADGRAPRVLVVGTKSDVARPPSPSVAANVAAFAAGLAIYPPPPTGPTFPSCVYAGTCSALDLTGVQPILDAIRGLWSAPAVVVPWLIRWPPLPPPIAQDLAEGSGTSTASAFFPVVRTFVHAEHGTVAPRATAGVHHTGSGLVVAASGDASRDPMYPIAADACVFVMRLRFASVAASQIVAWAAKVTAESCLQCPRSSLTLVVVGIPSTDYTRETRDAAARAAAEVGATFVCLDGAATHHDEANDVWHPVVTATLNKRRDAVLERSLWTTDQPVPHAPAATALSSASASTDVTSAAVVADAAAVTRAHQHAASLLEDQGHPLLLAMNRRVLEAELSCERRVAQLRAELQAEIQAREAAEARAVAREAAHKDDVLTLRAEMKLLWQQLEEMQQQQRRRSDID